MAEVNERMTREWMIDVAVARVLSRKSWSVSNQHWSSWITGDFRVDVCCEFHKICNEAPWA